MSSGKVTEVEAETPTQPKIAKIIVEGATPAQQQEVDEAHKVVQAKRKAKTETTKMDTSQRLEYACDAMGFDRRALHSYTSIDFCLDEIGKIDWVYHFVNLKELTIVNQSVLEIEGVQNCRYLEKIWLGNNNIETIKNVDKLQYLRQLYLSSNKIKKISGLDHAINLDKLWLDGNLIEQVDGLSSLINLSDLNLAANNIEQIGISLDNLKNVRELNLAGNLIGSFKEVLNLTRLPKLTFCNFSDPNYGENPICSLCNYQTYVMFHLINLVRLDMQSVGDDVKSFAESTFMKKRMYYNMRIKTIQRNTYNIMKLLKICKRLRLSKFDSQGSKISKKLQECQREIDERIYIPLDVRQQFESICTYGVDKLTSNPLNQIEDDVFKAEIDQKRGVIFGRILERLHDVKVLENNFKSIKNQIYEMADQNIGRLITELDTGGNIRFEEGRPQDKWYTSCVDLVRSRFNAEQMKSLGVLGITVTRVTKIHNRFLRNRFEEKLEQLVDLSDNQYKRSLEYLFYGVNPQAPKEIHRVMEQGFRTYQEYEESGLPGCISLVNSISSAETPRINYHFNAKTQKQLKKDKKDKKETKLDTSNTKKGIPPGQILVCKIFLQKCVYDNKTPFFDSNLSPTEIWNQSPINTSQYQKVQCVYRVKESDPKQRMWYVLDNALVLPEYLVDFDYNMNPKDITESKRLSEITQLNDECNQLFGGVAEAQKILQSTSQVDSKDRENKAPLPSIGLTTLEIDRSDMNYVKKPLHKFMSECHIKELMDNNYEFTDDKKNGKPAMEDLMAPEIPLRSQFTSITEQLITNLSCQLNFTKITYLNLFNNCIRKIEALEKLVNLEILVLSFNQIQEIKGLEKNVNLVKVEINNNFIRLIDDSLITQQKLERLNMQNNWIQDISQTTNLIRSCPNLKELNLKGNPVSNLRGYRALIFATITNLETLDGLAKQKIDSDQKSREVDLSTQMIDSAVQQQKKFQVSSQKKGQLIDGWQASVEELNLCHLKITKISNLDSFSGLRKLSLLDNKIAKISGLEKLTFLEELSLEKNKLTTIQSIECLKYLKKLDLGSNKIKKIQNLNTLTSLAQLSLENNEIARLDGIEDLQFLMELYLGNNMITDIREIVKLKDLPRLIILDISCNPGANNQSNRVYCIFHLRKLRVLDGISIDPQEHLEAKETFSGRLTEEIMSSRLQGRKLTEMRELDLSNCKLRDFEDMFDAVKIPNIRELNLNNNLMSSLRCLGFLPTLKILRLKSNKIETLYCKPNPEDKVFKKGLFGMPSIEQLDVSSNLLQYLYGLQFAHLKDLRIFLAADNQISKIEHLEKLKSLKELDLSKNKITRIEPNSFALSNQITLLKLEENSIKSLSLLENLIKLQTLLLANNRIGEFIEIERVADLPDLVEFSLVSNPIQRKQNYRFSVIKRMPQLIIFDGKEIPQEERKRVELAGGGAILDITKQNAPLIHFAQPQGKVQVKVNNVNFETMFNNQQQTQQPPQNMLPQRQFERNFMNQVEYQQPNMGMQIQSSYYDQNNRVVPFHELVTAIQDNPNLMSRDKKRPATNKQNLPEKDFKQIYQQRTEAANSIQNQAPSTFQTVNRDKQTASQQASQQSFQINSQSNYQLQNPISLNNPNKMRVNSVQSAQISNQKLLATAQGQQTTNVGGSLNGFQVQPLQLQISAAQQHSKPVMLPPRR